MVFSWFRSCICRSSLFCDKSSSVDPFMIWCSVLTPTLRCLTPKINKDHWSTHIRWLILMRRFDLPIGKFLKRIPCHDSFGARINQWVNVEFCPDYFWSYHSNLRIRLDHRSSLQILTIDRCGQLPCSARLEILQNFVSFLPNVVVYQ